MKSVDLGVAPASRSARTDLTPSLPNLVFLPGALGAGDFWRPVGDRLPAEWNKVYLSWPGLGAQPPSPSVRCLEDCVTLVEKHLHQESVLLAHSMGGVIAVAAAARNPGRVRGLVLTATSGGVDVLRLGGIDWRSDYRLENPSTASWITEDHADLSEELAGIRAPTLLLWADADPVSPVAVGEHLRSLLPKAGLQVIPTGSHSFPQAVPDAVAPLILEFVRSIESDPDFLGAS